MVTVDDFSRLVAGVYRSALFPDEWERALDDVRRSIGATGGGMSIVEGASRRMINVNVPDEAMASYGAHHQYLDYVLAEVERGPAGVVRTGSELVAVQPYSEFNAEWMRPYEMDDGLFVRLTEGDLPTSVILAAPKRSDGFDTTERVTLLTALVPHLRQAPRMQRRMQDLAHRGDDLESAVDTVTHGIVLIGVNGIVAQMNSAAQHICRCADGLSLVGGSLRARRRSADTELQRAVHRAMAREGRGPWGDTVACPRPSGLRPYIVHVQPADGGGDRRSPACRVIAAIVDPEAEREPSATLLRRLWALTPAEAGVAVRIAGGDDPAAIAAALAVSMTTVRKHLQHEKTGTRRQAELVRLLLTTVP